MDNYNSNIFVDNTMSSSGTGIVTSSYMTDQYKNYSNNQTLTVRSAEATSDGKTNYIKVNLSLYTHILFTYYKHRLIPGHLTFKHDSAKIPENEPVQKFTFNELYGNETYCPSVNFQPSYTSNLHDVSDSSRTYTYVNVNRGPYYSNNHYGYDAPFLTLFHNSFFDEQLIQSGDEEIPVIDTNISQIRTFSQNRYDIEHDLFNNNSYQKNEIFLYNPQNLKDKHNYTNITRYPKTNILVNGTYKPFSFNLKKLTENTVWYDNNLFIENTKYDYNSIRDILEYDVTNDISYLNLYSIYTPHQFMWMSDNDNAMLIESSQFLNFAFNDYGQIWLHDKGVNGHSKQFADNIYIKGYSKRDYLWRESRWSKSFYRTKIFNYSTGNIALKGTSDRDDKYNPLCVLGLNLSRKEYYDNSGDTEKDRSDRFLELLKDAFDNSAISRKYNYSDPYGGLNNYRFAKLFCNEQDDPRKDFNNMTFSSTPHNTLYIDPFISKRYCESNFWTGRLSVLGKKGYNQYHKKTYQTLNISSKIRDNEYQPNKLLYVVGQRSYVKNVIRGYYYNEKFWKDHEHTQEIIGDRSNIYVDITSHLSYLYLGKFILDDGYFDNINVYTHQDNFIEGGYLNPVIAGEELLCISNYDIGYNIGSKDHYKNLFENKIRIDSIMSGDEVTGIDDIHLSLLPSKELNSIDEFRPYYRILVNEYTNPDDHGLITQELYDLLYNSNIYDQKCYGTNIYKYRFTDFIPDDIKRNFDIKSNRDAWLRRILSQNNLYDKSNIAEDFIKRDIQALNVFYDRSFNLFSKFLKKDGTVDMNEVISDKAISTLISFDKDTNSIVFDKNLSVKGFNETTKKPETYLKTPDDFKTLGEWTSYHTKYLHLFFASNNYITDSSIDTVSKTYTQTSVLDIQNINANKEIKKYDGNTLLVTTNFVGQVEPHSFQSMYFFPARLDFSLYIKTSRPVSSLEDDTPSYPFYFTKLIYSDTYDNWRDNGYDGFNIKKPASKCDFGIDNLSYKVQVKTNNGYETIAEYSISPDKEHTQLGDDRYMSIVEYDNKIKITPKPLFVSEYCKNVPIENKSEFIRILLVTGFRATSGCTTEISSKIVDNISSI